MGLPDVAESVWGLGAHNGEHLAVVGRYSEDAAEEEHEGEGESVEHVDGRRARVV